MPTTLKLKDSFSFKDTFVNVDDLGLSIFMHPAVMKQLTKMEEEKKKAKEALFIKKYGEYPRDIFSTDSYGKRFTNLLGIKSESFKKAIAVASKIKQCDDFGKEDDDGLFIMGEGCLQHRCCNTAAAFTINTRTDAIYMIMMDNGKFNEWTSDPSQPDGKEIKLPEELPLPLQAWARDEIKDFCSSDPWGVSYGQAK